jgi:hypothetical protein
VVQPVATGFRFQGDLYLRKQFLKTAFYETLSKPQATKTRSIQAYLDP